MSHISQNYTLLPGPAGSLCAWEEKHPQTGAAAYLAVLKLKLDLGVIDNFPQIPDNRFPSSLLEQAGEPLVQVFFLVFLVLNTLHQGFRKNKSEPVGGGGLMFGRDIPRTSSQKGFLRKAPRLGCLLVGLHASVDLGFGYCWEAVLPRQGEILT